MILSGARLPIAWLWMAFFKKAAYSVQPFGRAKFRAGDAGCLDGGSACWFDVCNPSTPDPWNLYSNLLDYVVSAAPWFFIS